MLGPVSFSNRRVLVVASALTLLSAAFALGCAATQGAGENPELQAPLEATRAELHGEWRLESFKPEQAADEALRELLGADIRIVFSDEYVSVTGWGSGSSLPYTLTDPTVHGATLYLHTDSGISYEVVGQLSENTVKFRSLTPPWRGYGVLVRP